LVGRERNLHCLVSLSEPIISVHKWSQSTELDGSVAHFHSRKISTDRKFPENNIVKSWKFSTSKFFSDGKFVSAEHILQKFLSAEKNGGFPLGEIFRSNRNFYCSNSKDFWLVPSECLWDKRKFRFGRKISPSGKPSLERCTGIAGPQVRFLTGGL
jgi:hypothetical protein